MGRGRRSRPRELAGKLRDIRKGLALGQVEMASKLERVDEGVYPGMISRFEHGKIEPSLLVILEYARLAGVTTDVLIDDRLRLPKRK